MPGLSGQSYMGYKLKRAYMPGSKTRVKAVQKDGRIALDMPSDRSGLTVIALQMNKNIYRR